jgi:hypothetical protein
MSFLAFGPILIHSSAYAIDPTSAFTSLPSRFTTNQLTAGSRALGETCYSRGVMPDGTVCDPAYLDELGEGFLMARAYVGNGYSALSTANQLIFQPVTQQFLQSLFTTQNVTTFEANLEVLFTAKYFSASFSPFRVQYFSEVHNPDLPVIAVQAAVERRLAFAGEYPGSSVSPALKDFSIGTDLRLIQRNYVHAEFTLAAVIATSDSSSLQALAPSQTQYALLFDPAIAWRPANLPWKIHASLGVVNLGKDFPTDPIYPDTTDLAFGLGVEPPLGPGSLRLGVDLVNLLHPDTSDDGGDSFFRFGASYKYGLLEAMVGLTENTTTFGMHFNFAWIQTAIVYEFNRTEIEGVTSSNEISTELDIRL